MIWQENFVSAAFINMLKEEPKSATCVHWMWSCDALIKYVHDFLVRCFAAIVLSVLPVHGLYDLFTNIFQGHTGTPAMICLP